VPAVVLAFLAFFAVQHAIETWLAVLNLRHVRRAGPAVPPPLIGQVDPETAARSREYTLAKARFGLVARAFGAALTLAVLLSGILPRLESALARLGLESAHLFVAFLAALSVGLSLAGLPISLWSTFVLEQRFGFNRLGLRLWLADRAKGLALAAAIGVPLLYGAHAFMTRTGGTWWLWLFAFLAALQIAMTWAYPALIAPLFNRFSPLPEGELRMRLEALARDAGFRTRGLFVMDASKRSGHSNAYFTGFFRPRIVLFDTLVEKMSTEEVAAVLAHEMGHYQAHHVHRSLAIGLAVQLAGLWILSRLAVWPTLFQAFGFGAPSLHAAVALASLGGGSFTFFLEPLASWISRRHEYEADRWSLRLAAHPAALRSALVKLNGQNLSNLSPHPWYSRWYYTHPTLLERLAAIDRAASQAGGASRAPA